MKFIKDYINSVKKKPMFYVLLFCGILIFCLLLNSYNKLKIEINSIEDINSNELSVFVQDGCIHCKQAEEFLNNNKFDNISVVFYNLKDESSLNYLFKQVARLNIPQDNLGTPILVLDNKYIIGFGEAEKALLIEMINEKKN